MGYIWAQIAATCENKLASEGKFSADFYRNKLITAEYFFSHIIIETAVLKQRVEAGAAPIMALEDKAFVA